MTVDKEVGSMELLLDPKTNTKETVVKFDKMQGRSDQLPG